MTEMTRAQRQHTKNHRRPDVPTNDCWECQRERAHCRSKTRHLTGESAAEAAAETNLATDWTKMIAPYKCPWCEFYHLTKARPGTARWKRVEKRRRKWLTAERTSA